MISVPHRQPRSPNCIYCVRCRHSSMWLGLAVLILPYLNFAQPQIVLGQTNDQNTSRVFQDPVTGRTFRKELRNVNVRRTEWQNKPKTQTVYERQVTTRYVPTPRVVYTPVQTYALTRTVRGWWNPFRSPYNAYSYQPTTAWQASVQNQAVPVTTEKWVPKQQTIYVPEAVEKTEVRQQLVATEIPSNGQMPRTLYANQPAPRLRIPLLARQQLFPPQPVPRPATSLAATTRPHLTPAVSASRLRAVDSAASSLASRGYAAPLRTASAASSLSRDTGQSGISATVLR